MALTEESFVLYTNHDSGVVVAIPSSFQGVTLPLWGAAWQGLDGKGPNSSGYCHAPVLRLDGRLPHSISRPAGLLQACYFRGSSVASPAVAERLLSAGQQPAGADSLRLAVVRPSVCARRWRARAAGRAAGRQGGSSARVRRSRRRSGGGARHRGRDSCHSGCHSSLPGCGRGGWS